MSIKLKTKEELEIMAEGGAKLARVKDGLKDAVKAGVNAAEIEDLANKLIKKEGAEASFKRVKDYYWATCINVNAGIVHGIPHKSIIFKEGDVVSVDVGVFYKGFHTDTSFTVGLGVSNEMDKFLRVGEETLNKAIKEAVTGNAVSDISRVIEASIEGAGYNVVRSLVGHGVGRDLHEAPSIPCFVDSSKKSCVLREGMVIAIEVMYTQGSPELQIEEDNWTISTRDGKISALYEETVALIGKGNRVLTRG